MPDLNNIADFGVASMQTSMMNSKIDAMMPAAKELEQLTFEFEQLEAKWKVYLGLSVANELGDYDGSQGKSAKRKQAKQLRSDIQTEMRQALRGMLHSIMHEIDPE